MEELGIEAPQAEELAMIYKSLNSGDWQCNSSIYNSMRKHYCQFFTSVTSTEFDILYKQYERLVQHPKCEYANLTLDLDALRRGGI